MYVREDGRMFFKGKKKKEKKTYKIAYDNLAIPEIHIPVKKKEPKEDEQKKPEKAITYDTVAIPEIHVLHEEKNENQEEPEKE